MNRVFAGLARSEGPHPRHRRPDPAGDPLPVQTLCNSMLFSTMTVFGLAPIHKARRRLEIA